MNTYSFALLGPEKLEDLNALYQAAFQRSPKANSFLWKYFQNPAGNALLVGAYYDNKLVASGAMIPEKTFLFGKEELIFKCTDLMTHPEHQKKGLSKKINELLKAHLEQRETRLCYTLCSNVSTKSFLKNDWQFLARALNYFQPLLLLKIKSFFHRAAPDSLQLFALSEIELNSFAIQYPKDCIKIKKDSAFLQWRSANPKFQYTIIRSIKADGTMNGHLIFSVSDLGIVSVLDIESAQSDTRDQLLHRCESWTIENKKKGIVIFCLEGTPLHAYVKTKFYLRNPFQLGPLPSAIDLNILPLKHENIPQAAKISRWDLSGLNYDDI